MNKTPPRASAEEIIRNIGMKLAVLMPKDEHWRDLMTEIADQIQQAVEEAKIEMQGVACTHSISHENCDYCTLRKTMFKQAYAQGFAEGEASMRERAAKEADKHIEDNGKRGDYENCANTIAEQIRTLPPRGSETK